jgi:hypothetical protein
MSKHKRQDSDKVENTPPSTPTQAAPESPVCPGAPKRRRSSQTRDIPVSSRARRRLFADNQPTLRCPGAPKKALRTQSFIPLLNGNSARNLLDEFNAAENEDSLMDDSGWSNDLVQYCGGSGHFFRQFNDSDDEDFNPGRGGLSAC